MPHNKSSAALLRWLVVAEIGLILAVFALQGGWPVPDVNEPYYLGKAIDYWNPDWIANDPFLESADTHTVFYFTFGWLSLLLPAPALAWVGRLITWTALAWSWRRLSFAVWPRRWAAVLTAAIFVCLLERCQMAGEWVIGGVEAKGFAFVLVFLGLEALSRGRWNRTWLLFGAASAFHVLVGGWSVVAAAVAWALLYRDRAALSTMWLGLLGGFLLSLPGLVPSLALTWGTDPEVVAHANQIHVFQRLGHHLNPAVFPGEDVARFLVMTLVWAAVCCGGWLAPADKRLRAFVLGTLAIAAAGAIIGWSLSASPSVAAGLLRFYWFRMSDVAVPLGLALAGPRLFEHLLGQGVRGVRRRWWIVPLAVALCGTITAGLLFRYGRLWLWNDIMQTALAIGAALILAWAARRLVGLCGLKTSQSTRAWSTVGAAGLVVVLGLVPLLHLGGYAGVRVFLMPPRSVPLSEEGYGAWRLACRWVAEPGNVPKDARFLTPRMSHTFKWYAGRGEVATWKDVPQDAPSIVRWWGTIREIHANPRAQYPWHGSVANSLFYRHPDEVSRLLDKYDVDYILTFRRPPLDRWNRNLRVVYDDRRYYRIYQVERVDDGVGP